MPMALDGARPLNRGALAFAAALIVVMTGAASIYYFQERPHGAAVVEFDRSKCPSGRFQTVASHPQGGVESATTELDAILQEVDSSSVSSDLTGDARRIVTSPEENGFLAVERKPKSATFSLLIDGDPRASVTIRRFGEHSFSASGSTSCID